MKTSHNTSLTELERLIERYPDIEYVDAILSDMSCYIRGKRFPVAEAGKIYTSGVQIPESTFLLDFLGAGSDPCGRGFSDGDPDGTLFPIPGTTQYVPWGTGRNAQVLMELYTDDGSPSVVDPRHVAASVLEQFNTLGYRTNIAFELEFYLLDGALDEKGRPKIAESKSVDSGSVETQVYSLEDLDKHHEFLRSVHSACEIQGIPASVVTSEYSPSQYEINLRHVNDPLTAADHCILLKRVVRDVALTFGMRATFMAKPFIQYSGNGMHLHLSLEDDSGKNVFQGKSILGNSLMRHAIGGLLDTTSDMFAIFAPGRNSYRRFVPDLYVPVNRSWGYNNRSVAIRIPSGDHNARRLEHRIAGADANPYLVLAALLAGVHHGIVNSIDPGEAAPAINVSGEIDETLPLEWENSVSVFQSSKFAATYLTSEYVELYCAVKRDEINQYLQQVTGQEYLLYL